MKKSSVLGFLALLVMMFSAAMRGGPLAENQALDAAQFMLFQTRSAPISAQVLVQSPAETDTELQIICLFESSPENTLHGSLAVINQKLQGLLDQIRNPTLFRGDLGETLLLVPPAGGLPAKSLLMIGLGDSQTFTAQRMDLVGSIAYRESNRLGIRHPYFASTILDGGVARYKAGEISEAFMAGFLRAARTEKILQGVDAAPGPVVQELAFLSGAAHATDTKQGIEKALAAGGK